MRPFRHAAPILLLALGATACAETFSAGAAVINGVSISQDEVDRQVDAALGTTQPGAPPPSADARLQKEREVLQALIQQELVRQEATRRGITADETRVQERLEQLRGGVPEADFAEQVRNAGLTMESLLEQLRLEMAVDEIRAQLVPEVTEAELREVYELSLEQFKQVKVRHILWSVPQGADGKKQERQARATLVELQAGANFARLAQRRSDDTGSAQDGGLLPGWTTLSGLVPEFAQSAGEAPIGEVTEPVRTQFGWHLILVEARRTQPFADVKDQLRSQLESQAGQGAFQELLGDLQRDASIVVNPRFGDWDPTAGQIVPHSFFQPPEPETDPNAPPVLDLPSLGVPPQ